MSNHVEQRIANRCVTKALVDKVRAKVFLSVATAAGRVDETGYTYNDWFEFEQENKGKIIPELLHGVFYYVVNEDLWDALKRFENPTIDFNRLQIFIAYLVKQHAEDLF